MKTIVSIALAAVLAACLVPSAAKATSVADCQAQIAALVSATNATSFDRGDEGLKTQARLVHHLNKASRELDKGDLVEALEQMASYQLDLSNAVIARKISEAAAAPLATGAADVITCIQSIN